jgi:hypothetical protein
VLVGFLAVLVLMRRRAADAEQDEPFGEITILPIGAGAKWSPVLLRQAAGAPLPANISSRDALALWFCISAGAAGVAFSLALPSGEAPAALVMTLPS